MWERSERSFPTVPHFTRSASARAAELCCFFAVHAAGQPAPTPPAQRPKIDVEKKISNRFFKNSGNPHDLPVPRRVPILSEKSSKGTSGGPKLHGVDVRTSTKKYRSTPKNKCLRTEYKKNSRIDFL